MPLAVTVTVTECGRRSSQWPALAAAAAAAADVAVAASDADAGPRPHHSCSATVPRSQSVMAAARASWIMITVGQPAGRRWRSRSESEALGCSY